MTRKAALRKTPPVAAADPATAMSSRTDTTPDAAASDRSLPRPRALVSDVYNAILDRITSLEIAPGARILSVVSSGEARPHIEGALQAIRAWKAQQKS